MRFVIGVLLCLFVEFGAGAADRKPIVVGVGQEFEIVLDSPSSSDRHWLLAKPLDGTRLKEAGRQYRRQARPNAPPRTCEVLRYRALTVGKAEVYLKFTSLFEQETAATPKTNFVVMITEAASKPAK